MTKSASRNPASTSPWPNSLRLAMLEGFVGFGSTPSVNTSSWITGAEGFIASSTSVTWGSTS